MVFKRERAMRYSIQKSMKQNRRIGKAAEGNVALG